MLDLNNIKFTLVFFKIFTHFLNLCLLELLFLDLEYFGLEIDHSFFELVTLLCHFRYLNLLGLIFLP